MRNDLYVTLERGEFEKGGKSVARNVEITVCVLDTDGLVLKVKHSLVQIRNTSAVIYKDIKQHADLNFV